MRWRLLLAFPILCLSVLLTNWPTAWQPFLETAYTDSFYPFLQRQLTQLPATKNFALVDVAWLCLPLLLIVRLLWLWRKNYIKRVFILASEVVLWIVLGYFLFMVFWGLNYQKPSLYQHLINQGFNKNLNAHHWQFAVDETLRITQKLPEGFDVCKNEVTLNLSRPSAFIHSTQALANLSTSPIQTVKPSAWSFIYTGLSTAGVYSPFTGEPTYNADSFALAQPFIMLHEYAHWTGLAREYDADILAYWSAWLSPDPVWQYSAWLVWWTNIGASREQFAPLPEQFKQGVRCYLDYNKSQKRWKIRKSLWKLYEANLKSQGVKEGLKSYQLGDSMALTSYQQWLAPKSLR